MTTIGDLTTSSTIKHRADTCEPSACSVAAWSNGIAAVAALLSRGGSTVERRPGVGHIKPPFRPQPRSGVVFQAATPVWRRHGAGMVRKFLVAAWCESFSLHAVVVIADHD